MSFILCQSIGGHQLLTIVLLFLQSFFFFQVICPTYSVVTLRDHVWAKFQRTVYLLLPVKKYKKGCHKGQRRNDEGYYSVNCD